MTWIAGGLALLLLLSVGMYVSALKQTRNLVSLVLLILVDEEAYARHRLWLAELVRSINAEGPNKLHFRVVRALDDFAMNVKGPATSRHNATWLWVLKQRQQQS